jgi:hypothetical protein
MVDRTDCAVVFGAGLDFLTMSFGASLPPVPLIQVDVSRANIGRYSDAYRTNKEHSMVGQNRVRGRIAFTVNCWRSGDARRQPPTFALHLGEHRLSRG